MAETTRPINMWNTEAVEWDDIALKSLIIMPSLLLQKPSYKSKSKQSECLEKRLLQWESGDFNFLVKECRAIQCRLELGSKKKSSEHVSCTFAKLTLAGKVNAAMRLLDESSISGVLQLSEETLREQRSKHPESLPAHEQVLMTGEIPFVDPVMFSAIDESTISRADLHRKGPTGPSKEREKSLSKFGVSC